MHVGDFTARVGNGRVNGTPEEMDIAEEVAQFADNRDLFLLWLPRITVTERLDLMRLGTLPLPPRACLLFGDKERSAIQYFAEGTERHDRSVIRLKAPLPTAHFNRDPRLSAWLEMSMSDATSSAIAVPLWAASTVWEALLARVPRAASPAADSSKRAAPDTGLLTAAAVLNEYYDALQDDDHRSIIRALITAKTNDRPFDPLILLGCALANADLAQGYRSETLLLKELARQKKTAVDRLQTTLVEELRLPVPSLPTILADEATAVFSASEADAALLKNVLDCAKDFSERVRSGELQTAHILAALIGNMPMSVADHLSDIGFDVDALRENLHRGITERRPKEDPRAWAEILGVHARDFYLRNLISRDTWTIEDALGYEVYADAIAHSIIDGTTQPPLTVGIQAPWGQGKTSLMRMIRKRIDPDATDDSADTAPIELRTAIASTYSQFLTMLGALRESGWLRRFFPPPPPQAPPPTPPADGMLRAKDGEVPSVWFNPLYYRESSQVWAGMAHAILHQLVGRLEPLERETFWLRLQMSRINVAAVRRDVHELVLTRFAPRALAWAAIALLLAMLAIPLSGLAMHVVQTGAGLTVFGAVIHFITYINNLGGKTLDRPFEKYVTEPNYDSQLGLLHLVDHDLDRALRLLVGNSGRIAVFIDDLDRCDPQTVNQVILAINQFVSLPKRNVFFFLGMDMEMVVAALEQAQKETNPMAAAVRRSFGWRFMEKFVQLPFVIPRLDTTTAARFASQHILGASTDAAPQAVHVDEVLQQVEAAPTPTDLGAVASAAQKHPWSAEQHLRVQRAISARTSALMRDPAHDEVQRIVDLALAELDLNPRTIKRYFALVRVLRTVQIASGVATQSNTDRAIVMRAAHLQMNWPQFAQWLRNNPEQLTKSGWKPTAKEVDDLARSSTDHATWCDGLKTLVRAEPPSYVTDASLYRYLARIAGDPPGLVAMCDARMF
jgi:hypothetical protein